MPSQGLVVSCFTRRSHNMPELPEVETVARTIEPDVTGRIIVSADVRWARTVASPTPQKFKEQIKGQLAMAEESNQGFMLMMMKMLTTSDRGDILVEQVSFVLGRNYVLSFQENGTDVFGAVRDRLKGGKGRLRQNGSDYLIYALIDAVVDQYFAVLEMLGERIESCRSGRTIFRLCTRVPCPRGYIQELVSPGFHAAGNTN